MPLILLFLRARWVNISIKELELAQRRLEKASFKDKVFSAGSAFENKNGIAASQAKACVF